MAWPKLIFFCIVSYISVPLFIYFSFLVYCQFSDIYLYKYLIFIGAIIIQSIWGIYYVFFYRSIGVRFSSKSRDFGFQYIQIISEIRTVSNTLSSMFSFQQCIGRDMNPTIRRCLVPRLIIHGDIPRLPISIVCFCCCFVTIREWLSILSYPVLTAVL
jgi:hypothetical protein